MEIITTENLEIIPLPSDYGEDAVFREELETWFSTQPIRNVSGIRNIAMHRNGYYFTDKGVVITLSGFVQKAKPGSYLVLNDRGVIVVMSKKILQSTYPKIKVAL